MLFSCRAGARNPERSQENLVSFLGGGAIGPYEELSDLPRRGRPWPSRTPSVAEFIKSGGIISWGIIPTESTSLATQTPETLAATLSDYWEVISRNTALPLKQIAEQALVAPARCCLKDTGQLSTGTQMDGKCQVPDIEETLVEKAFALLPELSQIVRDR